MTRMNSAFTISGGGLFLLILLLILLPGFNNFILTQIKPEGREIIKSRLDELPDHDQVDYSPADGITVNVNPPPFTWLPVKKDITLPPDHVTYGGREFQGRIWVPMNDQYPYSLQISRDSTFMSDVITRQGLDISTHALDRTLEPGEWFWRYGVENKETIYSKTRRFTVPSDLKEWPFPADIRQVIRSIPKDRPRLFILNDEVDSFRERALHGDLKATVSEIKKDIGNFIGEDLPSEPEYSKDIDSWWDIYNSVIPPSDMSELFGLVYLLTGEKKYGEEARRRVLHFARWDPDGSTSDRGHNESNYRIVDQGSRAYDWTHELYTADERKTIEKSFRRRATQLYERLKYRPGSEYHVYNRGSHEERITGFLGQAALCFADEWEEAEDWLKYVLTIHWNLYPGWAKEDGGWHQGPAYWTFYQFRALHFITTLEKVTGIDLMKKDFFQNTPYYILYTNPPYARLSPFGDGAHNPPTVMRAQNMYYYSSLLNDPYLRWYADYLGIDHPKNILGVILKNDSIIGKPPTELPHSRSFPGVGLVSLHTDLGNADEDIHFLFHSDPYGGVSHGHPDQNAFTIEAFGQALAIASGYYPSFGSDHHMYWSRQTMSSNTVTLDGGKGQQRLAQAKGRLVLFENADNYDYILGDATEAYMGLFKKFHRHVVHIRPGIFIIYDDLEATEPVTFEWWLHALSEMDINKTDKSIIISEGGAGLKVKFLQGELKFDQFTGFPHPPEFREYTDVTMPQYSTRFEDQWHLTGSTISKSHNAKFFSVLIPFKQGRKPKISVGRIVDNPGEVSLEVSIDGKEYFVSLVPEVTVKETTW